MEPQPAPPAPAAPRADSTAARDAPRPRFVVHVVDVGTGLAVFVEGPDFTLVYDGGSNDDVAIGARNRFTAYLRAARPGLGAIDHVVLSHPHRDHVELLPDVVATHGARHVWDSGVVNPICGYRRFVEAVASAPSTRYHTAAHGEGMHEIDFGRTLCKLPAVARVAHAAPIAEGVAMTLGDRSAMTFLHVDATEHADGYNENSLVTLLELDGGTVLLMGDAEAGGRHPTSSPPKPGSVEGRLLSRHAARLDADVLVVGHHGSKTSSRKAFLDAVSPKVSVISSGPARYGHVTLPDPEVVDELRGRGELLRTDLDDAACAANPGKIGPDADGQPGGCDHVRIELHAGKVTAGYARLAD